MLYVISGEEAMCRKYREETGVRRQKRRRTQEDKKNAYMTVEAALCVPLVIACYMLVIYTAFYMYDRCVIAQEIYCSLMEICERRSGERAGDESRRISIDSEKLFILAGTEITCRREEGTLRDKWKAHYTASFGPILKLSGGSGGEWNMRGDITVNSGDPALTIRSFRRLRRQVSALGALAADGEKDE